MMLEGCCIRNFKSCESFMPYLTTDVIPTAKNQAVKSAERCVVAEVAHFTPQNVELLCEKFVAVH